MVKKFTPKYTRTRLDENSPYRLMFPEEIQSQEAEKLIDATIKLGALEWADNVALDFTEYNSDFTDSLLRPVPGGMLRSLPRLAYWCMKASTYLGLDEGRKTVHGADADGMVRQTRWSPFEQLFRIKKGTLRRAVQKCDFSKLDPHGAKDFTKEINDFFDWLESGNEQ